MTETLLPPNATAQERAIEQATARIGDVPIPIKTLWDPWTCPAEFLAWLAWSLHVDAWDKDWTEAQKRTAIKSSIEVHRTKGTIGSLRRALEALGYEIEINENTGQVFTFRLQVDISEKGMTDPTFFDQVAKVAERVKNARSHLLGVDGLLSTYARANFAAAQNDTQTTDVMPFMVNLLEAYTGMLGAYERTVDTTQINPA